MKKINIKGKPYVEVHERVIYFRQNFGTKEEMFGINTKIEEWDKVNKEVITRAWITDPKDRTVASGLAHEAQGAMLSDGTKLKCIRKDNRSYKEEDVKAKFAEAYKMCQKFDRPKFTQKFSHLVDEICETTQSVQFRELKK